jgi:hypothetical protein
MSLFARFDHHWLVMDISSIGKELATCANELIYFTCFVHAIWGRGQNLCNEAKLRTNIKPTRKSGKTQLLILLLSHGQKWNERRCRLDVIFRRRSALQTALADSSSSPGKIGVMQGYHPVKIARARNWTSVESSQCTLSLGQPQFFQCQFHGID